MNQVDFYFVVVGGGPSGATAANDLAVEGCRVLLLDRECRRARSEIGFTAFQNSCRCEIPAGARSRPGPTIHLNPVVSAFPIGPYLLNLLEARLAVPDPLVCRTLLSRHTSRQNRRQTGQQTQWTQAAPCALFR